MGTIHQIDPLAGAPRVVDSGGGGEPPVELLERLIKIETTLPALATKDDLAREIGGLRTDLHKEIGGLRADLYKEVGGLRSEFHKEIAAQTWRFVSWVTGLFVTIGGALVAATYFIAKHG